VRVLVVERDAGALGKRGQRVTEKEVSDSGGCLPKSFDSPALKRSLVDGDLVKGRSRAATGVGWRQLKEIRPLRPAPNRSQWVEAVTTQGNERALGERGGMKQVVAADALS